MQRTIDLPFFKQVQEDIDQADYKVNTYLSIFYFMRVSLIVITGAKTIISGLKNLQKRFPYE